MKILRNTYLSLGSNSGEKLQNLQNAIYLIDEKIGSIKKVSPVYLSEAWGFKSEQFLNICIEVSTCLNPEDLLTRIHLVEKQLGRIKTNTKEYIARTIDIDILLFENEIIFSPELIVPHKEMLQRKFVLVPLAEICPSLIHPIEKRTIKNCLANCTDAGEIHLTDYN